MSRIIVSNVKKDFRIGAGKKRPLGGGYRIGIRDIFQAKKRHALRGISFDVQSGEVLGIVGGNGSGKSTLLRVIAGIHTLDEGSVKTNGKIVTVIALFSSVNARMPLADNTVMLATLYGLKKAEIKQRLHKILQFAEMEDYASTKFYQLSKGMKVRAIFSTALYADADILILDEAFSGVDAHFRNKFLKRLLDEKEKGLTVLIATHQLDLARKYCDRVMWLEDGRIKKIGNVSEILKQQKNFRA
tara:strand:+ start:697 stop:1428 length:732 start_codon:yes stop_codon:yes gene_type:complete